MKSKISVFWFRRDLRLEDNIGLYKALSYVYPVLPVFIFDKNILGKLQTKEDRRVDYIHQSLHAINTELRAFHGTLNIFYGDPLSIFKKLSESYAIQAVFCNRDYEPEAITRDLQIDRFFNEQHIPFKSFKDQVIFDTKEVLKNDDTPYTVYTPYSRKWKQLLMVEDYESCDANFRNFYKQQFVEIFPLSKIGFKKTDINFAIPKLFPSMITEYDKFRDYPAMQKTTALGVALRFGTISIRKCVDFGLRYNQVWLNELIWREFFMQILYHFPHVVNTSFKAKYDHIRWRNNTSEFEQWCQGQTGYPIIDAGMRQLNETGFMHNRIRMIAASFLCKHLLIDWRWGEAYFAQQLNDYDLSANNGNWQWAAGCGCDAAPYFRIFNPATQTQKFDKNLEYIMKWLPEYGTDAYPKQIVEHGFARTRALKVYAEAVRDTK